jgi:hypothetical protein
LKRDGHLHHTTVCRCPEPSSNLLR